MHACTCAYVCAAWLQKPEHCPLVGVEAPAGFRGCWLQGLLACAAGAQLRRPLRPPSRSAVSSWKSVTVCGQGLHPHFANVACSAGCVGSPLAVQCDFEPQNRGTRAVQMPQGFRGHSQQCPCPAPLVPQGRPALTPAHCGERGEDPRGATKGGAQSVSPKCQAPCQPLASPRWMAPSAPSLWGSQEGKEGAQRWQLGSALILPEFLVPI